MKINKAYKLRIYPTVKQGQRLLQIIGACRFVWNYYLERRKAEYLENKSTMNYYDCAKDLTELRRQPGTGWLADVLTHPLQQSLRDLDGAYNRFFKKVSQFPKFKSKHHSIQSFRVPANWRIRGNHIQVHRGLLLRFRGTLPVGEPKSLTIKLEGDKWYAVILTEQDIAPEPKTGPAIGIDLGLKDLAITSEGKRYANLRPRKLAQQKIKKASQSLARKQRGSNRRAKAKQELTRLHAKVRFQRMNHIHQISHCITSENQAVIVCEDLGVRDMMGNHRLAGSIADAAWRELLRQLEYKQVWRGGEFEKIDRYFPSSKTCSACGHLLGSLPLSVREWTCPKCKEVHDRDVNAARVILQQGARNVPCVENSESTTTGSMKREYQPANPVGLSKDNSVKELQEERELG